MTSVAPGIRGVEGPAPGIDAAPEIDAVPPVGTEEAPPDKRRRRKALLLIVLLGLAGVLLSLIVWYLWFRQPITDILPLPAFTNPPAYQLSIYGLDRPLDVAVTADGSRIIVTQGGVDPSTVMLDASGTKLATLAPPPSVTEHATQLYVAIHPTNGEIYATDRTNGAVYRYDSSGAYMGEFAPIPLITGWQPLGIAFDAQGTLYVTDVGGEVQRVHQFETDGTLVRDFGAADALNYPNGIAIDSAGYIYVADSSNGRLVVFNSAGARLGVVPRGAAVGDLGMPRGVAVDGKGRVYVVDAVAHNVQMYRAFQAGDAAPQFLNRFGRQGTTDGAFEFPNGVAVDSRGRVYVADWFNNRLQIWSY